MEGNEEAGDKPAPGEGIGPGPICPEGGAFFSLPKPSGLLLVRGQASFILAGLAGSRFPLCIETYDGEVVQGIDPGDIVAVSAPEGGQVEPAYMLLELVRTYHVPLVVLPKDHPGSRRLKYVVSAGPRILMACGIVRGTHPEQHLLCSSEELGGLSLRSTGSGIRVGGLPAGVRVYAAGSFRELPDGP
jgi:hypothetical protein